MSLRVRFTFDSGASLGWSIERLADGLLFDFMTSSFVPTPGTPLRDLVAGTGNHVGLYQDTLTPTPTSQFTDGAYVIYIHDHGASNQVIATLTDVMVGGDDGATSLPAVALRADGWNAINVDGMHPGQTLAAILSLIGGNLNRTLSAGTEQAHFSRPVIAAATASTQRASATSTENGRNVTITPPLP